MVASTISLIMPVMTTIIASIQCNIVQVLCAVYLNPWSSGADPEGGFLGLQLPPKWSELQYKMQYY